MSSNLIVNNIEVGAGATIYTAASNQLTFGTNGTERLRIGSAGLISIGDESNLDSQLTITQAQGDCIRLRTNATNNTFKYGIIKQEPYNNNALGVQIIGGKSDSGYSEVAIGGGIDGGYAATHIDFYTGATTTTATGTRRLRIASDGDVIIGGTDAGYPNFADNLTIHDTQHSGITIRSGIASQGAIYFSDATGSGAGTYVGNIIYDHSDNHMRFATSGTERVRIHQDGWCMLNTSTLGNNKNAKELVVSYNNTGIGGGDQGRAGITIRSGQNTSSVSQPGYLYFSDGTAGSNEGIGGITYDHSDDKMHFTTGGYERLRIKSDGVIQTPGTTKIKPHSVGIGTTSITNTGVGTAYGEMMYNTTTNNVQVYTTTTGWYNVSDLQGYYKTAAAASSDGMNHYWGGSGSTSIISGLTPSGSPDGAPNTPTFNHTAQSYYGDYPYFDFASGNDQVGYMFLKSGTKWGAGPFTICFWVDVQGVTMESESTYVQLGSHAGTRSMYTVSVDADRKLKAITIGDDTGVSSDAQLIGNTWQHVAVTYNTSRVTKYYINGSLVRSHTHNSALDVGTSSQYIYLGYGYWNAGAGNKAAIAHMSDIGIWDAKELNATEIKSIYNAKRIIRGY